MGIAPHPIVSRGWSRTISGTKESIRVCLAVKFGIWIQEGVILPMPPIRGLYKFLQINMVMVRIIVIPMAIIKSHYHCKSSCHRHPHHHHLYRNHTTPNEGKKDSIRMSIRSSSQHLDTKTKISTNFMGNNFLRVKITFISRNWIPSEEMIVNLAQMNFPDQIEAILRHL
jgi:hypothetical protein